MSKTSKLALFFGTFLISFQVAAYGIDSYYAPKNVNQIFNLPYVGLGVNFSALTHRGVNGSVALDGSSGANFGVNLLAGYGHIINKYDYLGAELFVNSQPSATTGYRNYVNAAQTNSLSRLKNDYDFGGLLRGGFFPSVNTLVYALIGVDFSPFRVINGYNLNTPAQVKDAFKHTVASIMPGMGIEVNLPKLFALRAQYSYLFYSSFGHSNARARSSISDLARGIYSLSLIYHFAWLNSSSLYRVVEEPISTNIVFNRPYIGISFDTVEMEHKASVRTNYGSMVNENKSDLGDTAVGGTVLLGYGAKLRSKYYFGGEVLFRYAGLTTSVANSSAGYNKFSLRNDYSFGGDLKAGVLITPNTLFYGLFGVEGSEFRIKYGRSGSMPQDMNSSSWKAGYFPGVGVETALRENIALKMQYSYLFYPGKLRNSNSMVGYTDRVSTSGLEKSAFSIGLVFYIP